MARTSKKLDELDKGYYTVETYLSSDNCGIELFVIDNHRDIGEIIAAFVVGRAAEDIDTDELSYFDIEDASKGNTLEDFIPEGYYVVFEHVYSAGDRIVISKNLRDIVEYIVDMVNEYILFDYFGYKEYLEREAPVKKLRNEEVRRLLAGSAVSARYLDNSCFEVE